MKQFYETPALNIVCFAPWEALAASDYEEFQAAYGYGGRGDGESGVETSIPNEEGDFWEN